MLDPVLFLTCTTQEFHWGAPGRGSPLPDEDVCPIFPAPHPMYPDVAAFLDSSDHTLEEQHRSMEKSGMNIA